jgi:eukaryotic-like serine/threonine-protein kinase
VTGIPLGDFARSIGDRYRIERELGAGGMATVYLAEDLRHHRQVAIKALRSQLSAALDSERFLKEIELTAHLTHPHILPLLDSGNAGGRLYYVMPYIAGESLRDRLARESQLPVDQAVSIATQVASALDYAHRQGVIHRDIKPENILLHDDQALVADFGVALNVATSGADRITGHGVSLGTPGYMSPEQAAGERTLDGRSDIHAVGVLLYEMLIGDPPFVGSNPQAVIARVIGERPHPPRAMRDAVPRAVDAAVMRALAKAPADRFATIADFSRALAPPPEPAATPSALSGRARRMYAIAAIGALVVAGVGWAFVRRHGATSAESGVAGVPPRQSIAVLPFENLVADTGMAYFAAGVQDEILTKLAGLGRLKVISRTSTQQYGARPADLRQVAHDLGVASFLEGSVQRAGDQVRVNVQLIDAASDAHVWAQTYDRDVKNVFAVESDVAERVAEALQLQLEPAEAALLASAPTRDPVAYDFYLKGQHLGGEALGAAGWDAVQQAIEEYKKAVRQDSSFAIAYAELAFDQALLVWAGIDRSQGVMREAEANVRRALALQPNLPQAHLVLGYVYRWGYFDAERALAEYQRAAAGLPNSADVAAAVSFIRMAQGQGTQATAGLERAMTLDPRNPHWPSQAAIEYATMGDYASARHAAERALTINAGTAEAYFILADVELLSSGDGGAALAALDRAPRELQGTSLLITWRLNALLAKRDFAAARVLSSRLESAPGASPLQIAQTRGNALWLAGDRTAASEFYKKAIALLVQQVPGSLVPVQSYAELALASARIGRHADVTLYARMVDSLAGSRPVPPEPGETPWLTLAQAHASEGDATGAAAAMRKWMANRFASFTITPASARTDPTWDSVRNNPAFQAALIAR